MSIYDQRYQQVTHQVNFLVSQPVPPRPVDPDTLAAAMQQLAALPLGPIPTPAPLPPGSRMPLSPNPLFVGRAADLQTLAAALKGGETAAIGPLAAATGLGGIGKTQLASEFVHRYGQFFAGGVCWLSFATAAAVRGEVAACGGAGALELRPDFGSLPIEDQERLVVAAWQSPLPRLLVFDNCEDEALLAQWRPSSGGSRVLVTSRRTEWKAVLGVRPLSLDVLRPEESLALLLKYHPDLPADDAALQGIASTLGHLPLALHLAGSFLQRYRDSMTPAKYLEQLRQPDLLEHPSLQGWQLRREVSPTLHEQHVARTFTLSYERLDARDATDALAQALLARAACFAPGEPIPRDLLLATRAVPADAPEASLEAEDALVRLCDELGLLERATGALRLHRLLAAFVQAVGNETGAQDTVEQAIVAWVGRRNAAGYLAELSGVQVHLRAVTETAQSRQSVHAPVLCNLLGSHSQMIGDYEGARQHHERALELLGRPVPTRLSDRRLQMCTLGQSLRQLQSLPRLGLRYLLGRLGSARAAEGAHDMHASRVEALRAYNQLPRIYSILNQGPQAKSAALCALNLADEVAGVPTERARAYIVPSAGLVVTPLPRPLLDVFASLGDQLYGRRARSLAQRSHHLPTLAYVLKLTSFYSVSMGQWARGRLTAEQAREIFLRLGDWQEEGECMNLLADVAYFKGDLANALHMRTELYKAAHKRGATFQQAWAQVWQGAILLRLGQTDEAVTCLEVSSISLAENRDWMNARASYGLLALAHFRRGDPRRAQHVAEQAATQFATSSLAFTLLPGLASVAEVSLALWEASGDQSSPERGGLAESAWKACKALRYTQRLPIGRSSAWLWQGLYAWLAGKPSKARTAWKKSLKAAERFAMPYEQGLAHYELGRHLGADEPARQVHLTRACDIFTQLHAAYDLVRAQQVLGTR